ncbi:hypothetical protein SPRG_15763 [Saprolegnia parasitica CBS 223.65]|uniref:Major facilitator superfamily (MFS) profile domain-containing protein n=1 Tax=Saprolegnia parasitica (strain CBS 223.65) TaxID=695850 RepID=A0A067BX82_SAPPC|nr:hypothetical protein SPRG_15763 [Saprolegnia parasitica CBS 223.65]KDO18921.1 hypothetical protein SPRG_15763 [Saprolegnia parasitica CBS 223.65]|eukprot:XP_012210365.1 hypothetical protein SPRG_15763 [Saprolegnia parasitica CBS 223.65]
MRATPYELHVLATPASTARPSTNDISTAPNDDDENKLPPTPSLGLILVANFLFNVSFYIIVPTATLYARSLGATDLYSGLVIGSITLTSALSLVPLQHVLCFRDYYMPTLHLAASTLVLGHLLYALAHALDSLGLLLVGRLVNGLGFTGWLFVKRYCTDPRLVGYRRRTMCANLLVAAQTLGMVGGPLLGAFLAKYAPATGLWNAFTAPGWLMAFVWLVYWLVARILFVDAPPRTQGDLHDIAQAKLSHLDRRRRWTVLAMALGSLTIFFELGAWESNIPVFIDAAWAWTSFDAGVLIAIGGFASFALILPLSFYTKRCPDRLVLAAAFGLALAGTIVHQCTLVHPTSVTLGLSWFLVCWGMNLGSTITLSLLTKTLPDALSDKAAIVIQLSNYSGRLTGAMWGTAGSVVGGDYVVGLGNLGLLLVSTALLVHVWRSLDAPTG